MGVTLNNHSTEGREERKVIAGGHQNNTFVIFCKKTKKQEDILTEGNEDNEGRQHRRKTDTASFPSFPSVQVFPILYQCRLVKISG